MNQLSQCEFLLLRYVPDLVKNEFVNIGLIFLYRSKDGQDVARARFARDWTRLQSLAPQADTEMLSELASEWEALLQRHSDRESLLPRLHASLSNSLQITPLQGCLAGVPEQEIDKLAEIYLESRRPERDHEAVPSVRQRVLRQMRDAFESAGVWRLMQQRVAVSKYTQDDDPLRIDCGYRSNGSVKLFHALSIETSSDSAKALAFSYPRLKQGIRDAENRTTELTAILSGGRGGESSPFALQALRSNGILVSEVGELPRIAEQARRDLRV